MEQVLDFLQTDSETLITAGKSIGLALIFTILVVYIVTAVFRQMKKRLEQKGQSTSYLTFIKYVILTIIYFAAFSEIISVIPSLSSFLKTLLAGSGVAAIILSVAAQEPIGNLVSGLIIIFAKPFKIGDIIRYVDKDMSGIVEEITLRHTVVRTFENKRLIIPNGVMNNTSIENATYANDPICNMLDFNITYESNVTLAMSIITDVILLHPNYYDNRTPEEITAGVPPIRVLIIRFDVSYIVVRAWVWAKTPAVGLTMKNDILLGVNERFKQNGVKIAYPHTTVVVEESH